MQEITSKNLPERNPKTHKAHQREVLQQITLPFLISLLVVVVLAGLAVVATSPKASLWGDISLIYLIVVGGFFSLGFLAVSVGLAYAIIQLNRALPPRARIAHDFFSQVSVSVRTAADKLVQPLLRIESLVSSSRAVRTALRRQISPDKKETSQSQSPKFQYGEGKDDNE